MVVIQLSPKSASEMTRRFVVEMAETVPFNLLEIIAEVVVVVEVVPVLQELEIQVQEQLLEVLKLTQEVMEVMAELTQMGLLHL